MSEDADSGTYESGTDRKTRTVNGTQVWREENKHGVRKDHVQVDIGTTLVELQRRQYNPLTDRTHDLTKLSDDGYLKKFLALLHEQGNPDVVDLGSSPVLTFDSERWEYREVDGQHVLVKREAETKLDELVLESPGKKSTGTSQEGDR